MNMCLILNGYRVTAVRVSRPNSGKFFLLVEMKSEDCKRKVDTADELLCSQFGCCWLRKERRRLTQTNSTPSWHTTLQSALRLTVGFWDIYCGL